MEDFNCDEMIDRAVYGDRMHVTELSVKNDEVECTVPKLAYSFATHSKVCTFSSQK